MTLRKTALKRVFLTVFLSAFRARNANAHEDKDMERRNTQAGTRAKPSKGRERPPVLGRAAAPAL